MIDFLFKEVRTFEELAVELRTANLDTLIIFDIDDVLVVADDALFHPFNRKAALKEWCFERMRQHLPQHNGRSSGFCQLLSTVFLHGKRDLVHSSFPYLIAELQHKKIHLLGLTKCEVGLFGKIERLEEWKLKELKQFDINFNFMGRGDFVLDNIRPKKENFPLFKEGVLFADQYSKGETFLAFLDKLAWQPPAVLFVDDLLENIEDVGLACKREKIPFIGIHCCISHLQERILNNKAAHKQIEHLITNGEWICDTKILSSCG